jgi:hypothetical protein
LWLVRYQQADFHGAQFGDNADFDQAQFDADTEFGARFSEDANFRGAQFGWEREL